MTKGEKTRQMIIEKAAPIFNRKGMAGTSISDIMEVTKLAKGGIYRNFENKDEICLESFNFLCSSLSAGINEVVKGKLTAKDKLFALLDYYRDKLALSDTGCPLLNFGTEADDTNPVIKKRVAEKIKAFQDRICNLVKMGIDEGEFQPDLDAGAFAIRMFTFLEGAIWISKVFNNNQQAKMITDMLKNEIEGFSE
jgi:TetR/AcrR family transcriptional repressor of nem operon